MASFFAYYPPGSSSSNASVAPNGGPIPADSTLVAGENPSGNVQPLQTDSSGALIVTSEPGSLTNVNLTEVGGAAISEGQKTSANSVPVVIASDQSAIPISASSLPLPTGAATSALQTSGNASLTTIAANQTNGTQVTQISGTVPLPTGAATAANQTNGSQETQIVQGGNTASVSAAGALKVDGSAVTQPISASSLPLPTGASTSALQSNVQSAVGTSATTAITVQGSATGVPIPVSATFSGTVSQNLTEVGGSPIALGQTTMSASLPVAIASNQSAIPVSATSLPLPTGAATAANQINVQGSASGGTAATVSQLDGGIYNATPPTLTNGQQASLQLDSSGNLKVSGSITANNSSVSATGSPIPASATQIGGSDGTDLRAISVNSSGQLNINNISGTVSLPTGAATSANQTNASQKTQIVDGSGNVIASTSNALNVQVENTGRTIAGSASANAPVYNLYSSTNITTTAYVQLVASTSNVINTIHIFDSSGQAMIFATGASGSEVIQLYVPPGGDNYTLTIPAGTRIAYKALTATASSGYLLMSYLE